MCMKVKFCLLLQKGTTSSSVPPRVGDVLTFINLSGKKFKNWMFGTFDFNKMTKILLLKNKYLVPLRITTKNQQKEQNSVKKY